MPESSYNAPRLHVAIEARKIVISGEVAGLQIQLGPPAVPGRFNSCDLPPISSIPIRESLKNSFESVNREWHSTKANRWTVAYYVEIIKTFDLSVFLFIGKRPIGEIKLLELLGVLRCIEKCGALEKTRKVCQSCGEVFRYAIITSRAEYKPAPDSAIVLVVPR